MNQPQEFILPLYFDLSAVTVFALSGAAAAMRRGYDVIGVAALAFVTALGGALIRDSLFLQQGPSPVLMDGRYLLAVGVGILAAFPFYTLVTRLQTPMLTVDAIGLAVYTIVGAQKSLMAGIAIPGVILIAVINGVGGSILRDIITREEPLLFKPGQYYAAAALTGAVIFLALHSLDLPKPLPTLTGIATIFALRMAAIRFNWRTSPLSHTEPPVL